ncbi:poly [ADP-ribose] polymerase 2 [Hypanus sabinus]|uniref:poly [ADP-ribose] polymerase 2 n=1 Tax=Hypanus sabinus TaxID=79690 RepID=UPI0028C3FF35|nr:poly [ADP-ribose] polymerase 2 [Hypanus sabinus]
MATRFLTKNLPPSLEPPLKGSEANVSRRRKVPGEEEDLEFRWEWEADGGKWSIYLDEHGQEISRAFRSGSSSVLLSVTPATTINVDLQKMVQVNTQTGFERRFRCAVKDKEDYYLWQWEDDGGSWQGYNADTCRELERTKRQPKPKTVSLTVGRNRYLLDTSSMRQVNKRSQAERKMGRVLSDAVQSTSPNASPVSAGPCPQTSAPAAAKRSRRAPSTDVSTSPGGEGGDGTVRTLVVKGKAAVDAECREKQGKAHVYYEADEVYDALLSQTNLQFNNNKFYIIQLLQDDDSKRFNVWMRWGRVGKVGQNSLIPCGADLQKAKEIFEKKFFDKTKNEWSQRANFEKVAGKYDMLTLDYSGNSMEQDVQDGKEPGAGAKVPQVESKLDHRLQELMKLICDIKTMEEMVLQMKYDTKKAPLGKLTTEQIKAGYCSLRKIEDCLNRKVTGKALLEACNEFYTRIPHDFGLKTPPLISTRKELQEKISLLEALSDIEVAIGVVKKEHNSTENPLDRHYHALQCSLQPLEHSSHQFQVIKKYLQSTHAPTHNEYKMKLLEVFEVARESEQVVFRSDLSNRRLLWHGSRLSNWVSILNQGLRVAPPEAPVTGYMFGKGIYFADMSSKSANYCFATREHNLGLLLLSEVALGNCNELLAADAGADRLPAGKHSTMGLGRVAPKEVNSVSLDGVMVPMGPGKETGVKNPHGYTLNYNEYVVYQPAQVRMRYLLKVQFDYVSLW